MSDYLAVVSNCYGGGSWARGKDKDDTVKRAAKIYKQDWKHLFNVKGPVQVNVIDVEGYDEVTFGDRGIFSGKERIDRPIELVSVNVK